LVKPSLIHTNRLKKIIREILRELPFRFRRQLRNVAFALEPTAVKSRRGVPTSVLLGLYEGWPLTHRSADGLTPWPDRITLFADAFLPYADDPDKLRDQVRQVVWHEVGHYFGLDEDQLTQLEKPTPSKIQTKRYHPRKL
jgi:predicted Zn-dependent protease with MMP-like domain